MNTEQKSNMDITTASAHHVGDDRTGCHHQHVIDLEHVESFSKKSDEDQKKYLRHISHAITRNREHLRRLHTLQLTNIYLVIIGMIFTVLLIIFYK